MQAVAAKHKARMAGRNEGKTFSVQEAVARSERTCKHADLEYVIFRVTYILAVRCLRTRRRIALHSGRSMYPALRIV